MVFSFGVVDYRFVRVLLHAVESGRIVKQTVSLRLGCSGEVHADKPSLA